MLIKRSNNIISFAIVGCGRVAERHIDALTKLIQDGEKIKLVALCDLIPQKLAEKKERFQNSIKANVETFTDLDKMLQYASPDVLVVATPSGLHVNHSLNGLKHGCHLLVEKPFGLKIKDIQHVFAAAEHKGKNVFCVMQNRCNPTIRYIHNLINDQRTGKIFAASLNLFWHRGIDYYNQAAWRGTRRLDGGILFNQGIHYIDLLQFFLGKLTPLSCKTERLTLPIETEESVVATLISESQALVSLCATVMAKPKNFEVSLTMICENGVLQLGGPTCTDIITSTISGVKERGELPDSLSETRQDSWGAGHSVIYKNVLNTLHGNSQAVAGPKEINEITQVVTDLYQLAGIKTY